MAIHFKIHPDDEKELDRIRTHLWKLRQDRGVTQAALARKIGKSEKWLNELERGIGHPHLSSLQLWASFFDLRVQPNLQLPDFAGFHVPAFIDTQLSTLWHHAKQFDAAEWVRQWCVAQLNWERCWRGISAAKMSRMMGLSVSAVSGWERDGRDPLVSKIFIYARHLGGHITFDLVKREDW